MSGVEIATQQILGVEVAILSLQNPSINFTSPNPFFFRLEKFEGHRVCH